MKKLFLFLATFALVASCTTNDELLSNTMGGEPLVLTGYSGGDARTHFGTPDGSQIPYFWSEGDYIWLGSVKSNPIAEDCRQAQFVWSNPPSAIGAFHIFYNMTGNNKTANVLAEQNALATLGANGDFGYAVADEFGIFCLDHKTSYIWFDTKSNEQLPKLVAIEVVAAEGLALAGERVFDYKNNAWESAVVGGSNRIVLNFGEGVELKSANNGVFAAMVTLPVAIGGTELNVVYSFADGSTFTEVKNPRKDLVAGDTQRISTTIALADLKQPEPELGYELRVLTFEDKDAKFEPYELEYGDWWTITKWSDLIDNPQYMGPLTYGDCMTTMYRWYDQGNTELMHTFPDNYAYCFWGGGHAISNYWGTGYTDEDRNKHIAKYYGQGYVDQWTGKPGADGALGWFNVQMMVPVAPHSGENFVVHYGYKDFFNYIENLPEIVFADDELRVIDHMYVTNTNYTLNQLVNGVKSEEGNTFGGSWEGLNDDAWLKIVAYGFDDAYADAYAEPISQVEFYLVQGTNVVTDWQKWDLSPLGKVAKVRFNFLYSDDMGGKYGFTIPGYFAYDDIAVRFEK